MLQELDLGPLHQEGGAIKVNMDQQHQVTSERGMVNQSSLLISGSINMEIKLDKNPSNGKDQEKMNNSNKKI